MNEVFFNVKTRIWISLPKSKGLIIKPQVWNDNIEEIIKKESKNNDEISIIYFKDDCGNNDLFQYNSFKQKLLNLNINNLITIIADFDDNLISLKNMLNIKKVVIFDNDKRLNQVKNTWVDNEIEILKWNDNYKNEIIFNALKTGNLKEYKKITGNNYLIYGKVVKGQQNGRKIGFPTANVKIDNEILKQGVYLTKTKINNKQYWSMSDIWTNPITGLTIETNIFDFDKDIYDQFIEIELMDFHRENKKVNSLEEVKELIKNDLTNLKEKIRKEYEKWVRYIQF